MTRPKWSSRLWREGHTFKLFLSRPRLGSAHSICLSASLVGSGKCPQSIPAAWASARQLKQADSATLSDHGGRRRNGDAQDNDWRCCCPSSPGHCITDLGCERDCFERSRNAPRFACSDRGLLVRMVGGLNGSTQRRSILPMLL